MHNFAKIARWELSGHALLQQSPAYFSILRLMSHAVDYRDSPPLLLLGLDVPFLTAGYALPDFGS